MVEESVAIQTSVSQGSWRWVETLSELSDPFFVSERQNACAHKYATQFGPHGGCAFRFHMVVERKTADTGTIVFTKISPASEEEVTRLDLESPDPHCPEFLQCLAGTRIGASLPIPEDDWQEMAIHQSFIGSWTERVEPNAMRRYAKAIDEERRRGSMRSRGTA